MDFFAESVPELLMRRRNYLIELLGVVVATFLCARKLPRRYIVIYIDTEASRVALIKAYSDIPLANAPL